MKEIGRMSTSNRKLFEIDKSRAVVANLMNNNEIIENAH